MAGDFNCTLDPLKDKSSGTDRSHSRNRGVIHHFMKEMNLIDVWREDNPNDKKYSCYSSTHQSYSRIDFFLVSATLKCKIKKVTYDAILLSDHAPNSLVHHDSKLTSDIPKWRFKTKWLADSGFVTFLDEQIKYYFETNTVETSGSIRWEAFKAYIRGQIINITSSKAKETHKKAKSLETIIKKLEEEYYQSGSQDTIMKYLHQKLYQVYYDLNKHSTTKVKNLAEYWHGASNNYKMKDL